MAIEAFEQFMKAVARKWTRGLNPAELEALSDAEFADYIAWAHGQRQQEPQPVKTVEEPEQATVVFFDFMKDETERDYEYVDSRQRFEHGE